MTAQLEKQSKSTDRRQADEASELRKQRKALESERKKSSDALARLAEERLQLEKERLAFQQVKKVPMIAASPKKQSSGWEAAPLRVRKAGSTNTLRQSSTASALQAILDGAKDTPPQARALAVAQPNVAGQKKEKVVDAKKRTQPQAELIKKS